MDSIKINAMAKINLALDVVGIRDNGYHDVKMIMQSINLYDELTISKQEDKEIKIISESKDIPLNEDNLIYKSAKLMMDTYSINEGVVINLKKSIPVAAGMAGGSTDAAAVFKGMNTLFDLGLSIEELMKLGVKIGADVPYCIMGGTALSEGIGEILTPISAMPECSILIAKPDISVSTKYVYTTLDSIGFNYHPDVDKMIEEIDNQDIDKIASLLGNALEAVTIKEYPIIDKIKAAMIENGAIGSLMSGSGPTVFGIFKDKSVAENAYKKIVESKMAKDVVLTVPYNNK